MRRGLMTWTEEDLPLATLHARHARLRAAMQAAGLDAILAYTTIARPAATTWLSGFTPYWSEGLFLLGKEGDGVFATALSKRVAEWIRTAMPQGEIVTTPTPGRAIGERLRAMQARTVGVIDLDDLPARQAQALIETSGATLIDGGNAFDSARRVIDEAEARLMRRADALARQCFDAAPINTAPDAQSLIAAIEGAARRGGAEEIFAAAIPDLDSGALARADTAGALAARFALRASLACKGGWTRLTRSYARDARSAAAFARIQAAFDLIAAPISGETIEQQLASACAQADATLVEWMIEQPRGASPLSPVAGAHTVSDRFMPDAPFVLSLQARVDGHRWLGARLIA